MMNIIAEALYLHSIMFSISFWLTVVLDYQQYKQGFNKDFYERPSSYFQHLLTEMNKYKCITFINNG